MQLYDFKEIQERVILVGVQTDIGDDAVSYTHLTLPTNSRV